MRVIPLPCPVSPPDPRLSVYKGGDWQLYIKVGSVSGSANLFEFLHDP